MTNSGRTEVGKVPVSVLIPVKNEESNLRRCLESIRWADEIIVVDSQSTDRTVAIAAEYGAVVVQFHFNGTWPKKKNWSLENIPFRHDWVFILDADETLPPGAEDELLRITCRPGDASTDTVGYWINRRCMFMGKWLRHAQYPNWNLRFFQHRLGRFEKLVDQPTHSGDNEVHEHAIVQGRTARLQSEMEHYAFPTIEIFVEKHNRYSNWEARYAVSPLKQQRELDDKDVHLLRRLKLLMMRMPMRPLLRFMYIYVWQKGFLDGIEGYYFACLHGFYEFLSVAKTYELRKRGSGADG